MKKTLIVTVLSVLMLALGYVLRPTEAPYLGVEASGATDAESSTAAVPGGDTPATEAVENAAGDDEPTGEPAPAADAEPEPED
ncbi:MAG: hypothetical protein KDD51_00675 [Bdellovibrionales bacterium]|nr:hypothetical protein [Bdellovibrionales bacterium]